MATYTFRDQTSIVIFAQKGTDGKLQLFLLDVPVILSQDDVISLGFSDDTTITTFFLQIVSPDGTPTINLTHSTGTPPTQIIGIPLEVDGVKMYFLTLSWTVPPEDSSEKDSFTIGLSQSSSSSSDPTVVISRTGPTNGEQPAPGRSARRFVQSAPSVA